MTVFDLSAGLSIVAAFGASFAISPKHSITLRMAGAAECVVAMLIAFAVLSLR